MLAAFATPASAKQFAFVVGIDAYDNLPAHQQLKRAVSDARAVAQTFRDLNYDDVLTGENLTRSEFNALWQKLLNTSGPEDTVSIDFSGHGVEIDGQNFLIPRDFPPAVYGREQRVKRESLSVQEMLLDLRGVRPKAKLALLILDACRDHPLIPPGQKSTSEKGGLTGMDAPSGTFIMYAAGAGQTALDRLPKNDPDPNSVYTRKLIPLLKTKGLAIHELARDVRQQVHQLAATVPHPQTPAHYDELINRFCVAGCDGGAAPVAAAEPPAPASATLAAASDTADKSAAADAPAPQVAPDPAPPAPVETAMIAPPAATANPKTLTRSIQEGLKRAGCFAVEPTGTWGPKTTEAATRYNATLEAYANEDGAFPVTESVKSAMASGSISTSAPSEADASKLQSVMGRVCPLDCPPGDDEVEGKCVNQACVAGNPNACD